MKNFLLTGIVGVIMAGLLSTTSSCNNAEDQPLSVVGKDKSDTSLYIVAMGNEPFWTLQLRKNGNLRFDRLGMGSMDIPAVTALPVREADVEQYAGILNDTLVTVWIRDSVCYDNMAGNKFSQEVKVILSDEKQQNPVEFQGCGNRLPLEINEQLP